MASKMGALTESQLRNILLNYLNKRGFRQTEQSFREELTQTHSMEEMVFELASDADLAPRNVLSFNNVENDPNRYEDGYVQLSEWIHGSLDIYKPELQGVLYPVFLFSFLELVEKGYVSEARDFLQKHRQEHEELHSSEIVKIEGVSMPEHLEENELASSLMSKTNRTRVRLCQYSYNLMMAFLHQNRLMLIISILQNHLEIKVVPGMPSAIGEEEGSGSSLFVPGSKEDVFSVNNKEMLWGALPMEKPPDEKKKEGEEDGKDKDGAPAKKAKKEDRQNVGTLAPPRDRIPLPKLSEKTESEVFNDLRKRVSVSSAALPSVCFFTFLNTHSSLNTVELTRDASFVAAGYSDSTLNVWCLNSSVASQFEPFAEKASKDKTTPSASGDESSGATANGTSAPSSGPAPTKPTDSSFSPVRLIGHAGPVYAASFSPDNRFLITCSEDTTARLWSMELGSNLVAYKGHNYCVWDVAFSDLGYYFATASHDRTARIWSTDHISPLRILVGHVADVDVVRFHPNCNYVATGSSDKNVRLWDVQTGDCVRIFTGHKAAVYALAFSPDGRYLASAGEDKDVFVWDLGSSKKVDNMAGHEKIVWSLDWSMEGNVLASGGADQTVRLWDVRSLATSTKKDRQAPLLKTLRTKNTSVFVTKYTRRNLLLASGPFGY